MNIPIKTIEEVKLKNTTNRAYLFIDAADNKLKIKINNKFCVFGSTEIGEEPDTPSTTQPNWYLEVSGFGDGTIEAEHTGFAGEKFSILNGKYTLHSYRQSYNESGELHDFAVYAKEYNGTNIYLSFGDEYWNFSKDIGCHHHTAIMGEGFYWKNEPFGSSYFYDAYTGTTYNPITINIIINVEKIKVEGARWDYFDGTYTNNNEIGNYGSTFGHDANSDISIRWSLNGGYWIMPDISDMAQTMYKSVNSNPFGQWELTDYGKQWSDNVPPTVSAV
jgi:hypothetical protein